MKKLLSLTTMLLAVTLFTNAQSADESAIRTVLEAESKAFHTNPDRKAFAEYWHLTSETRMVYSGPDGQNMLLGDAMKEAVESGQLPPMDFAQNEYSNVVIKASGDVGWISFDQKSTLPDGKVSWFHEFRCLQKIEGDWKIISSSVHQYKP